MNVSVQQLGYGPAAAGWVETVLSDPSCMEGLPRDARNRKFRDEITERIRDLDIMALVPAVDGTAAGLFWGQPFDGGGCTVHQFVMPQFRGWPAIRCAKACADKAFELLPSVTHLIGFTPRQNRPAIACAIRAGFSDCGTVPQWCDDNDCAILIMKRVNNNG